MRKLILILSLLITAQAYSAGPRLINRWYDSTWFGNNVQFDTLVVMKGLKTASAADTFVTLLNANGKLAKVGKSTFLYGIVGTGGVTQGALDDSISAVRAIRKVDTIYKSLDSIVFKINGIRYAVLDSTGGGVQTLSISGDTLSISGGNSVILPAYVQVDSATVTSYDVLNSQNAPPLSPNVGDVYLVGNTPSGAWVGHAKDIAEWNGSAWIFTEGVQGDFLYNSTTALTYIFRSGNWVQTTGIPALNNGNTISSGLKIGTNNARSLKFETANLERGRIDSLGRYYIYDTSLRYSNKYVQVDSLTGRLIATEIPSNEGFIPLSGTEVGKPATGAVEFKMEDGVNAISLYNYNNQNTLNITAGGDVGGILIIDGNNANNNTGYGQGNIFVNRDGSDNYVVNFPTYQGAAEDTFVTVNYLSNNTLNFATQSALNDTASSLHTLIDAKVSTTTLTDSLEKKTNKLISFNTYTTSDTLRLSDADKVIEMNVGTANNLVIPNYLDYAFPVGTQITLIQIGAGQTTLVPASGVTVRSASSKRKLSGQYSGATLIEKAPNEWYLFGDITN